MIPDGELPEADEYTLAEALAEAQEEARAYMIVRLSLRNGTYHVNALSPELTRFTRHYQVRRQPVATCPPVNTPCSCLAPSHHHLSS